jgi:hypothetical protein
MSIIKILNSFLVQLRRPAELQSSTAVQLVLLRNLPRSYRLNWSLAVPLSAVNLTILTVWHADRLCCQTALTVYSVSLRLTRQTHFFWRRPVELASSYRLNRSCWADRRSNSQSDHSNCAERQSLYLLSGQPFPFGRVPSLFCQNLSCGQTFFSDGYRLNRSVYRFRSAWSEFYLKHLLSSLVLTSKP